MVMEMEIKTTKNCNTINPPVATGMVRTMSVKGVLLDNGD